MTSRNQGKKRATTSRPATSGSHARPYPTTQMPASRMPASRMPASRMSASQMPPSQVSSAQFQGAKYGRDAWHQPQKKRMSRGKKIAIGVACALLAVILAGGTAAALYLNSVNSQLQTVDEQVLSVLETPANPEDPFYVLVLGSDTRDEGSTGRSDTIILARVDPSTKDVTLVSIPRDTQVELEGHGTQKINAAYAFDGVSGAVNAVSNFAGVPIAHVVEIDFSGFQEIVDALGGVTVNVPANTEYNGISVPEGKQTLNGEQALVFARCRKTYADGDYQRTKNQRQLVQAIAKEVLNAPVTDMPGLVEGLASAVSTDMSVTDLVDLATKMRGMDTDSMKTAVVPSHSGTEDGVSYVFAEEPAWSEMMARIDAGEDPNVEEDASADETTASESAE